MPKLPGMLKLAAINVDFIDSQVTPQVSIYDGKCVYQTIEFLANYLDIVKPTKFDISVMYSNGTRHFPNRGYYGRISGKAATRYAQPSFDVTLQSIEIIAASVGHPIESMTMTYNQLTQLDSPIVFTLRDNQALEINSVSPTELIQLCNQFRLYRQLMPLMTMTHLRS